MSTPNRNNRKKTPPKTPLNTVTTRRATSVSSVSGISTPRSSGRRNTNLNSASAGLLQLANSASVSTPRRFYLSAEQQEELIERRLYSEVPAVGDSEEEQSDYEDDNSETDDEYDADFEDMHHELDNLAILDDSPNGYSTDAEEPVMFGAPVGWSPPTNNPEDYSAEPTPANIRRGQPSSFQDVDNPGNWSEFTYQAKFAKQGNGLKYQYHCLPTGVTPVPVGEDGRRTQKHLIGPKSQKRDAGEFEFHYNGWEKEGTQFRSGATRENPFPEVRKGSLCGSTLARLGLTKERMMEADGAPDALWFWQALLPIHDIKRTGIENDPRMPFYHKVAKWSNSYASNELDIGNGYGHSFKNVTIDEMVKWDGVVVMDGALGGSRGAILRRFDDSREDNLSYNKFIASAFTKTRFLEVKRVIKLCDNSTAPKRGQPGYDPAFKYDYIFKTLVHNTNALTEKAGLDLCGDETTFGHMGYGPSDTGLLVRQKGKMVTKGAQIVLISDVDRIRPRCYIHRHKLHKKEYTLQGQNEVRLIWEKMSPLLVQHPTEGTDENEDPNVEYKPRPIFYEKPHFTSIIFSVEMRLWNMQQSKALG